MSREVKCEVAPALQLHKLSFSEKKGDVGDGSGDVARR
jgi:hypothetical protein